MQKISHSKYLKISGIYSIINQINGKRYIGQAYSLYNRCNNHRNYKSGAPKLNSAIQKYGIENFQFVILEECPKELLNEREEYWILFYDTLNPDKGYNLIQRQDIKRIPCSQETKKKISQKFKELFPEGRSGEKNPFYGKKHSQESKDAVSKTKKTQNLKSPKRKAIFKIDNDGIETRYECFEDAADSVNGYNSQIHGAINKNTPYKKCLWIREEDKNKMTEEEFEVWKKSVCYHWNNTNKGKYRNKT